MIYVKGNKAKALLSQHKQINILHEASQVVLEIPEYLQQIDNIPKNKQIFAVITRQLTFKEYKKLREGNLIITNFQELLSKINTVQDKFIDDLDIFIDDLDIEQKDNVQIDNTKAIKVNENIPDENKKEKAPKQIHLTHTSPYPANNAYVAISFSTAGGVGKTFFAQNLATCVALKGIKTVAVDLDLRSSELDFTCGITDPTERKKIINRKAKVPKDWATLANWRSYTSLKENLMQHPSGIYVLPCYPVLKDIPAHEIQELLETLSQQFDFIMLDGGLDFTASHLSAALKIADTVYLIGNQDVKTIGKVSGFIAHAAPDVIDKSKLIINMVTPTGYYKPKEVAKKLGYSEYKEIPYDEKGVQSARRRKKAAVQLNTPAGQAVWHIATELPFNIQVQTEKNGLIEKIKKFFKRS